MASLKPQSTSSESDNVSTVADVTLSHHPLAEMRGGLQRAADPTLLSNATTAYSLNVPTWSFPAQLLLKWPSLWMFIKLCTAPSGVIKDFLFFKCAVILSHKEFPFSLVPTINQAFLATVMTEPSFFYSWLGIRSDLIRTNQKQKMKDTARSLARSNVLKWISSMRFIENRNQVQRRHILRQDHKQVITFFCLMRQMSSQLTSP